MGLLFSDSAGAHDPEGGGGQTSIVFPITGEYRAAKPLSAGGTLERQGRAEKRKAHATTYRFDRRPPKTDRRRGGANRHVLANSPSPPSTDRTEAAGHSPLVSLRWTPTRQRFWSPASLIPVPSPPLDCAWATESTSPSEGFPASASEAERAPVAAPSRRPTPPW